MKSLHEPSSFNTQLSNLKVFIFIWNQAIDILDCVGWTYQQVWKIYYISRVSLYLIFENIFGVSFTSLHSFCRSTINCMSAFLEAFQKISDMAQINNSGLQQLGIAMSRFCLRQRNMESRLKTFNRWVNILVTLLRCNKLTVISFDRSQINDCLVNPLSDRMEEWRRTSNQLDRDCVKEIRKAKSELQRAVLEAEKCKKRLRRKVTHFYCPKMKSRRLATEALNYSIYFHPLLIKAPRA